MDFAIPAEHWVKLKEGKKRNKYLDLARELKKLWNMKVSMIPFVVGALGTIPRGLIKGLEDLETWRQVMNIHCKDWPEWWEESWRFEETCCHLDSSERPSANVGLKNSQRSIIIIVILINMMPSETESRVKDMFKRADLSFWKSLVLYCSVQRLILYDFWSALFSRCHRFTIQVLVRKVAAKNYKEKK